MKSIRDQVCQHLLLCLILSCTVIFAPAAQATSAIWNGSNSGTWSTSANWDGSPATVPGTGDTATFTYNTGSATISLGTGLIINQIVFDAVAVQSYTIGAGAANTQTLTLENSGSILVNASVLNSQTFNSAILLGNTGTTAGYTLNNASTSALLTFNGNITGGTGGTGGIKTLNIGGAGNITVNGAITKGGGSALDLVKSGAGTLTLNNSANTFRVLTLNGGIIDLKADITLNNGGGTTLNGTGGTITASGGGRILIGANSGDWYGSASGTTIEAVIANGTGNQIDFYNTGTIILKADNTFTGGVYLTGTAASVSNIRNAGSNSNLGTYGTITFASGKLIYTGTGEATTKIIYLNGNATIDQSGTTGSLSFTAATSVSAGARLLTLQGSAAGTGDFNGTLRDNLGTLSVTKTGTGTWSLSGLNTYTGATTVSGGILNVTGTQGNTPITVNAGTATLNLQNANAVTQNTVTLTTGALNATVANAISGSAALTLNGGTATLSAANTYTGATKFNAAYLILGNNNALGDTTSFTSQVSINGSGTLQSSIANLSLPSTVNFAMSPTYTLTVNGANAITVNGSFLAMGGGTGTINSSITSGGTFTLAGPTTLTYTAAGTLTVTGTGNTVISGAINNGTYTGSLIKAGTGTLTLSGSSPNTFSGTTTITAGQVTLSKDAGVDALAGNVVVTGGLLYWTANNQVADTANITVSGGSININGPAGQSETVNNVSISSTASSQLGGLTANTVTITAGTQAINSGRTLTAGTMTVTGATISYTASASSGTLSIGAGGLTLNGATISMGGGAGATTTRVMLGGDFTGTGNNSFNTGTATSYVDLGGLGRTFNITSGTTTIAPIIQSGSLTKSGGGTLTLSGVNTFAGGATITAGVLNAGTYNALGAGGVTVNSGTLNLTIANGTYSGLSVSLNGNGVVNVTTTGSGSNSTLLNGNYSGFTGTWNISGGGKVQMNGADNSITPATINVLANGTVYISSTTYAHYAILVLNGGNTGESYGQLRFDPGIWAGPITLAGPISDTSDGFIGVNTSTNTGSITGNIGETGGSQELSKVGAGTIVLTGNNTYTGKTWIKGGALSVTSINSVASGNPSNLGSPSSAANGMIGLGYGTLTGTLKYTGASYTTDRITELAGTTGGGVIDQSGTGLLKFTNDATVTGNGSKLLTLQGSTTGSGEFAGAIMDYNNGAGTITSVTKTGTGTWTLSGANTFSGQVQNAGSGTLILADPRALGNAPTFTYGANGATLTINTATTLLKGDGSAFATKIVGFNSTGGTVYLNVNYAAAGGVAFTHNLADLYTGASSSGNIVVTGQNITSGTGVLAFQNLTFGSPAGSNSGQLTPANESLTFTTAQPVAPTANVTNTLKLDGTSTGNAITGVISDSTSGSFVNVAAILKQNSSTWTLSGANTYSGGTTLNAGLLNLGTTSTPIGSGAFTISGNGSFDNTAGTPLTINNDFVLSGGSPVFVGSNDMTINGTATISGATGRTITVSANTLTLGGTLNDDGLGRKLTKAGGGTLVIANTAAHTGGTAISAGTLAIGTDLSLGTGTLSLAGGALQSSGGARALNVNVTVDASSTIGGADAIAFDASKTFTFVGGSRTLTFNNAALTTIAGNVYLSNDNTTTGRNQTFGGTGNVTVSGPIANNNAGNTVAAGLIKTGSGTLTLNSANSYTGATTLNSGKVVVGTDQNLSGALNFGVSNTDGSSTTASTLDLTNANATFGGVLTFWTNTGSANVVTIGSTKTLTVNNNVQFGPTLSSGGPATTVATFNGGGAFTVNGTAITLGGGNSGRADAVTVDMSALGTFTASLGAAGTLRIGDTGNGLTVPGQPDTLILAPTSTITAQYLKIGNDAGSGDANVLKLGTAANNLFVDSIRLAGGTGGQAGRGSGELSFYNAGSGTVVIRDHTGTDASSTSRASLDMSVGNVTTGGTLLSLVDFTGHTADVRLSTLTMNNRTYANTGSAVSTFIFDTGTLDVQTAVIANKSGSNIGNSTATLTIGGGVANFGSIQLAGNSNGAGAGAANGTLNLTGGVVTLAGNISKIGVTGGGTGTASATVNLNGAALYMAGYNIGDGINPIDNLLFASGTLDSVGAINGTGGLTKTTSGLLTLTGTNAYTGLTDVQAGTLAFGADNVIADAASVRISGGTLNIATRSDTVAGVQLTSGNITGTSGVLTSTTDFDLQNGSVSAKLGGGVGLTKTTGNTVTLGGANTYTGTTTISGGTLALSSTGSIGNSGIIDVAASAYFDVSAVPGYTVGASQTLKGNGSVIGSVIIAGTLSPGNSLGVLSTGSLTIGAGGTGTFDVELGRSGLTPVNDVVIVAGSVTLNSGANLQLTIGSGLTTPQLNDIFYLVNNDGTEAVTGAFTKLNGAPTTLTEGSIFNWNSQQWKITYKADFGAQFTGGNDIALQVIPEPSALALVGLGLIGLMITSRWFRRTA